MNILELIIEIKNKVKKRLPISIVIGIMIAVIVALVIMQKPTLYFAEAKIFPLSANSAKGSSSPLNQLQQQFGISTETEGQVYDIEELIRSKRLALKIANARPSNKKYKNFTEWLVSDYNSELGWLDDEIILSDKKQDSLRNLIIGRSILVGRVIVEKGENGYTSLKIMAYEKELAREINENILTALGDFYIEFITEKPRNDLYKIQAMRDSLSMQLSAIEKAIAGVQDKSNFATRAYVGLPQIKLRRQQTEIQTLYTTTVAALQNAKFKLLSESPIFQVLDHPGPPYISEKASWKLPAVVAFMLSVILLSLWFCRKIFWSLIKEELKKA